MDPQPKRHVIPPAVEAQRMRRYSVILLIVAFVMVGVNYADLTLPHLLWFGALLFAVMGIVLGAAGVVMRGLQWHYDRLADELRGHPRVTAVDLSGGVREAPPAEAASQPKAG